MKGWEIGSTLSVTNRTGMTKCITKITDRARGMVTRMITTMGMRSTTILIVPSTKPTPDTGTGTTTAATTPNTGTI